MMKPTTQRTVVGMLVGTLLLAWFGVALLLFYVPRLAVCWAETGTEFSPAKKMLVQLGNVAGRSFFVTGLLFIVTLAAVAWRVAAARKVSRTRTG